MLPHVLNQVILKSLMSVPITQLTMELAELIKRGRFLVQGLNIFTLIIKSLVEDTVIVLVLDDHVVHDHTSSHHLPKLPFIP